MQPPDTEWPSAWLILLPSLEGSVAAPVDRLVHSHVVRTIVTTEPSTHRNNSRTVSVSNGNEWSATAAALNPASPARSTTSSTPVRLLTSR